MKNRSLHLLMALAAAAVLAACGGGGSESTAPTPGGPSGPAGPETPTAVDKFTQTATWTFNLPAAGVSVCYDFNAKAAVACAGTEWDLMVKSGGRSADLFTNSGANGPGRGGAFGSPFAHTWADLLTWKDALVSPTDGAIPSNLYFPDSVKSVFTGTNSIQSAAFEYGIGGGHQLWPNYRVFTITTNSGTTSVAAPAVVYAVQLTGYYGGAAGTTSGNPSFRWISSTDASVKTATVAATSDTEWTYYDLGAQAVSSAAGTWHIAFSRYNVKTNGGTSGAGGVAGFTPGVPNGFYEADGTTPIATKFTTAVPADTLGSLTAVISGPATTASWVKDSIGSQLTPAYTGTFGATPLNFGWYNYYSTTGLAAAAGLPGSHMIKANADAATLVRGGEGNTYARVRVSEITYAPVVAPTAPFNGTQTWTINFGVQPAP